jgi:ribonucleoside-diphosphate reductase alpha chain|tara:strand:+ start:1118 stop:2968 length:1851 start_codon:yes stop_codon:yes gene_type:complete
LNVYQQWIHKTRYARYLEELQRRENWGETVHRFTSFFEDRLDLSLADVRSSILALDVMPSMRCLMTAGKALERDACAGYNCSYLPIDSPRAFDEIMYVLMCGTGVGFSVERQYINQLPEVSEEFHDTDTAIVVRDSKIGWATALKELISLLYSGRVPKWDLSRVRQAGSRLKTFGGRASGSEPLDKLFKHTVSIFTHAKGRKLTSIECHDLVCHEGEAVVVGGVRRSATISLSNLTDDRMRHAKSGQWFLENGQRSIANNSVAYTETPDTGAFLREWTSLYESKSGERGIFNRQAAKDMVPERRDNSYEFGVNPCSEIVLRPRQFCNLSEVVCRPDDTLATIHEKIAQATWIGTIQSTLTDFRYLSTPWKRNTEEERLLGVSLTGIMDCPAILKATDKELQGLRDYAVKENVSAAKLLGIPESAAVTCVKPSGTVSQLVDSSSGIHPRHSRQFIRRVRNDKKDPISTVMIESGVPYHADPRNDGSWVFEFGMKSPKGAITRHDITALQHLDIWKKFALNWCEHKPSITVSVRENEWVEVGAWVHKNFNILSGVSFLPHADDDHSYELAPYEDCSPQTYKKLAKTLPAEIDWDAVKEEEDQTTSSQEFACMAGACEI